jgi:putative ABC transport system permease protein
MRRDLPPADRAGRIDDPRTPWLAAWILGHVLPREQREAALGDLAEEFAERTDAVGRRSAARWYWHQALASIPPLLRQRLARLIQRSQRPKGDGPMGTFIYDLRHSLRGIRRNPGFAAVVVLTLGLGIGANTVVFSTVDGVVLNPFPYPDGDRLIGVGPIYPKLGKELAFWEVISPPEYLDIETASRTLQKIVAWDMGNRQLTVGENTENLFSAFWWGNAFPTLGVTPALGRGFSQEEIERGDRVAVISHRVWQSRFGGDPSLVGGTVLVNGDPYTLVGIMPPRTLIFGTDLWIPMPVAPERFPRNRRQFQVLARLAPGATLEEANVELEAIARNIEAEYGAELEEYEGWSLVGRTWKDINVRQLRLAALILLGAVGFVLLLVCANVANLLLARSASRQRELAVRGALGAGRLRIVRQLLTESVVLALLGAALGVAVGYVGVRAVTNVLASLALPLPGVVEVNGRVLLVTAVVAVGAGLAFGIIPALQAARSDVQGTLREEAHTATGGLSRLRWQRAMVGVEVALALVLLVGGGLLINSFLRLQAVDPGFDTENVLTMRLTLARERYRREEVEPFFEELRRRVEAIPGVTAAATASQFPPNVFSSREIWFAGRESGREGTLPGAYFSIVSPSYFDAMGIRLMRGRALDEADRAGTPFVAVINETVARRYFSGADPIGTRFKVGGPDSDAPIMEIVGVTGDTRNRGLDSDPAPEIYVSSLQADGLWNQLFLLVRTAVPARSLLPVVREQVRAIDPEQPVYAIRTVEEAFANSELTRRVSTNALTLFGLFAAILAAVGIYGVVAFAVALRTREIGLRMALGAESGQVRRLMIRQALIPVVAGAAVGLAAAIALGRVMSGLLFQVNGSDPLTLVIVTLVLVAIALFASYVPALRASRLDPVNALRNE